MHSATVADRRLAALFGPGRLSPSNSSSSDDAPEAQDRWGGPAPRCTRHSSSSGEEQTLAALRPRWVAPHQVQDALHGNRPATVEPTQAPKPPRWATLRWPSTSSTEGSGSSAITAAPCGGEPSLQCTPPWLRWARRCALSSGDSSADASPAASPSLAASLSLRAASPSWGSPPWQAPLPLASPSTSPPLPQRSKRHSSPRGNRRPRRSLTSELERVATSEPAAPAPPAAAAPSYPAVVAVLPLLVPPELSTRFNLVPAGPPGWQPAGALGSPGGAATAQLDSWLIPAVATALGQTVFPVSASPGWKAQGLGGVPVMAGRGSRSEPAAHCGAVAEPSFSFQPCPSPAKMQQAVVGACGHAEEAVAVGLVPAARPPSLWSRLFCRAASNVKV